MGRREGNVEYCVKWKHWDSPEWDTWEPEENLENICPDMINEFENKEVVKLEKIKMKKAPKMKYEVEKIVDKKIAGVEFWVKWKKSKTKTWEPEENLEYATKKVQQFMKTLKNEHKKEAEDQEALEESFANVSLVDEDQGVEEFTEEISIYKYNIGRIIGRGGMILNQVRDNSRANIEILSDADSRIIRITGSENAVESARKDIKMIIENAEKTVTTLLKNFDKLEAVRVEEVRRVERALWLREAKNADEKNKEVLRTKRNQREGA